MAVLETTARDQRASGEATRRRKNARRTTNPYSPAHRGDAKLAWVLIAPALVGFAVFAAYPTLRGIYLSFTDFAVLSPPEWIGLDNYRQLLGDEVFWSSLGVTVYFVLLSVSLGLVVSVVTAAVLHRITSSTVIRGLIILPFLISGVVAGTVWWWMLDSQLGIVNIVIKAFGGDGIQFLTSRDWAIPSVALINVWKQMGYTAIIIFAGLQTIPATIYEAGRVDGASELRMFRTLTLPLLRPILALVVVLNVINAFQVFDIVSVTTKGGPANASNVLQMYIYSKAFGQFDFGYAATMSLALFVILIAITFLQMRLLRASESDTN
ncbi:sugar ABC transporter permease [Asanoa ishikariensis]|uniref:Multiple sugar transport system permease protein n=1 Tax=Asanoa ishikariensis TaxID=137265 RepID=A0A1H3UFR2_9ACTN|nr:sugar ABC transporter permease [Asanoa ishikariensis]GIF63624.1 sugar ABC transporter permease [Asanoa ishikariensis]SDZ61264.1 multiple sugar transport system permease protein [Asanoa ishikariensis]